VRSLNLKYATRCTFGWISNSQRVANLTARISHVRIVRIVTLWFPRERRWAAPVDTPRHGMNNDVNKPLVVIDSDPPIALDKFIEQSGFSSVTVWRYRRAGWLNTLNICGRHYLTRSEIARFNARAAAGEFAKEPTKPNRRR
jgi:hypothetical protein